MRKVVKVEFTEISDGEVTRKYLEGAELEKWLEYLQSVCTLAYIHNTNPAWEEIKWIEVGKFDDRDD